MCLGTTFKARRCGLEIRSQCCTDNLGFCRIRKHASSTDRDPFAVPGTTSTNFWGATRAPSAVPGASTCRVELPPVSGIMLPPVWRSFWTHAVVLRASGVLLEWFLALGCVYTSRSPAWTAMCWCTSGLQQFLTFSQNGCDASQGKHNVPHSY